MIAKDAIEYQLPIINTNSLVREAIDWCEQFNSKYLFLTTTSDKKNIYYIPLNSLYELNEDTALTQTQLQEFKYSISENQHLYELLKTATTIENFVLPITDSENTLIGFSTAEKILQCFLKHNQILNDGGTIVLSMNATDYSLSEISRITESNQATILNVALNYNEETHKIEITLKINRTDLKNIEASFERYNYNVIHVFHQSEYNLQMLDRIDNLIKYLQV